MNRFLLVSIGLLLLLGLTGYVTTVSETLARYSVELITIAKNLGIIMMLVNGTFISTRLFKVALFFIGLAVLGFLFKIMHLPGADELLLYPFIILFCVYLVHFIRKDIRRRLDFLKLGTLLSFLVLPPFIMLRIIPEHSREIFVLVSHVLFWVTFLDFLYTSRKECTLLRE